MIIIYMLKEVEVGFLNIIYYQAKMNHLKKSI